MDDPRDLVEGLTLLGDALDDPFVDLHAVLEALGDDLVAAIPGYLGLTVAVQFGEHPVVINTLDLDDAHEAAATLMLPLAPVKHAGATGTVVFYSRTAGAFGPMAGDVKWIFNLDGPAVLDAHLPAAAPATPVGVRGLTALCAVNQALGVLVADGFTIPAARVELHHRAARAGQTLPEVAHHLLRGLRAPGNGPET
jgi:hypothetical protein